MTSPAHRSVLLEATVNALVVPTVQAKSAALHEVLNLQPKASGVYIDATFGRGGHSRYLLQQLDQDAKLVVFDKDPAAIAVAQELAQQDPRVIVVHDGFANMSSHLKAHGIDKVNGVLMDLGVSSPQLDEAERGFSFMREGPLDMRMDNSQGLTAQQWLSIASVDEITEVIKYYGEERYAFKIAKAIDNRRQSSPINTTHELAQLVASCVRSSEKNHHPATRTFQAIRIYINQELQELATGLEAILDCLAEGARLAVISFHSLEDRLVKQFMQACSQIPDEFAKMPLRNDQLPLPVLEILGRVYALPDEVHHNPRSRSAVLRIAQRLPNELSQPIEHALQKALAKSPSNKGRNL